jgi:CubicO group peptidase (beta-lactamase class C family)
MRKLITLLICSALASEIKAQKQDYFPPKGSWETKAPEALKVDTQKLDEAETAAKDNETKDSRDLKTAQLEDFWKEPYLESEGPFGKRGDPTGLVIYKGYIIKAWGDPTRVEMTNSVTKSFLSTTVGLAIDKGLIKSVLDTIAPYMAPIELYRPDGQPGAETQVGQQPATPLLTPFDTGHNRLLTWDVMLRQTSDWQGTLWGKPDWADRPEGTADQAMNRPRNAPGTVWKYNDVRVNALALAATNVWRKPLPEVLKTYIMDPIGASDTWRWMGYRNAWIVIDGHPVQSVSGGGHWGGGMFINAYDMARFGLLTLHKGNWNGQQLISDTWVKRALTPTPANPGYGYMNWFLNTNQKLFPSAPKTAFAHIGNGRNIIYVDPEHDLVIVARWITQNGMDTVIKDVLAALK